ncbi:MAG: hypothetical protein ABJB32_01510 [Verrucomicrobiota bacterium]
MDGKSGKARRKALHKKSSAKPRPWSEAQIERARQLAIQKYLKPKHPASEPYLRNADPRHNVVAVGVARKRVKGRDRAEVGITFYVRHKFTKEALKQVPAKFHLPEKIHGIPTDVIKAGEPKFLWGVHKPSRPAHPGARILVHQSNGMEQFGTYGILAEDDNGRRYILSNNHVLANFDANPPGTRVFQPERPFRIARFTTAVPLAPNFPNDTDCALARLDSPSDGDSILPAPVGPLSSGTPTAATHAMRVAKFGAVTNATRGTVQSTALAVDLAGYHFDNLIQIEDDAAAFCDHGDSGALIVERGTRRPVGLLMGRMGNFSFACSLDRVLARLSAVLGSAVKILTGT